MVVVAHYSSSSTRIYKKQAKAAGVDVLDHDHTTTTTTTTTTTDTPAPPAAAALEAVVARSGSWALVVAYSLGLW